MPPPAAMPEQGPLPPPDRLVCLGVIAAARGLKGDVWIRTFTAEPAAIAAYGPLTDAEATRRFRLRILAAGADRVLARIDGVADRTGAEALRGTRLYVRRAALPETGEDEFYHADLIGLAVSFVDDAGAADAAGEAAVAAGRVSAVHDFGAGPLLEIALADGGEPLLLPFTRAAVPEVDLARQRIVAARLPEVPGGDAAASAAPAPAAAAAEEVVEEERKEEEK